MTSLNIDPPPPVSSSLDEQPWSLTYLAPKYSKGRMVEPPGVCLSVILLTSLRSSVVVCPEDSWDRTARAIGLSREFQTGQPEVDARFMLSGYIGDELATFFRSPETHQSLRELFDLDFDRVEFFQDEIRATCRPWPYDPPGGEPPEQYKAIVPAILRLRAGLALAGGGEPTLGSRWHHAIASFKPPSLALLGLAGGAGLLLLLAFTSFLSTWELIATLGPWSAFVAAAAIVLVGASSRRFAFRGSTLAALAFALFCVVLSGTLSTLALANEWLDTSPAIEHSQLIQDKWSSSSRSSTSYDVAVPSWRADHAREQFSMTQWEWQQVRVGQSRLIVHSRAGRFGVEWIDYEAIAR